MDALRDWRGRILGATGGALLAPVAIVCAALVVGVGGGGLGALSRVVTGADGPALATVSPTQGERTVDRAGRLLARVAPERHPTRAARSTARARRGSARRPAAPAPVRRTTTTAPATGGPTFTPSRPQRSAPAPATTAPAATAPAPAAATPAPVATTGPVASAPAATATPVPAVTAVPVPAGTATPLRKAGDGLVAVTEQVPLVGRPVGQVVDGVVDVVGGVLHPAQP
jgi:hypothetical protein